MDILVSQFLNYIEPLGLLLNGIGKLLLTLYIRLDHLPSQTAHDFLDLLDLLLRLLDLGVQDGQHLVMPHDFHLFPVVSWSLFLTKEAGL